MRLASFFTFLALLFFGACSDQDGSGKRGQTPLPDGESCEPHALLSCLEEGGPQAVFCAEDGLSTEVLLCEGTNPECRRGQCVDFEPGQVCYPNEVEYCLDERGKRARICNRSRTGFTEGVCHGSEGDESMCANGACSECFPNSRKCLDDATVVECRSDGSGWEVAENCDRKTEVCTGQSCEELCARNIKFNSYIGCDYFAVDLDNAFVPGGRNGYYDAQGAQFAVVVANPPDSERPATVTIEQFENNRIEKVLLDSKGEPFPTEPLEAGELRAYKLPARDIDGTTLSPLAYRVSSSVPIVAYQFNPLENENVYSNDASLLLPASLLGTDYYVMTREQTFHELRGYVTVVGVMEGETEVAVTVSAHTQAGVARKGQPDQENIPHMKPGDTRIFKLRQFDVLNIETDRPGADLTGSRVVSNKRVAVFGGSEAANAPNTARCINIDPITEVGVCEWDGLTSCRDLMDCVNAGFNVCCADHLEQQMFPLSTWGSHYIASKSWERGLELDIYRIMAAEDNTQVRLYPPLPGISIPILNQGEHFEFETSAHFEIESDNHKPILVGQFLAGEDAPDPNIGGAGTAGDAGTGDPAFMLLIPVEQYRNDYVILTPAEYAHNYINVVSETGSQLFIDGLEIPFEEQDLIGTGEYSVYRQALDPGPHTILSTEPTGVLVYGYDQYVSYGYTGGMNLEELRSTGP